MNRQALQVIMGFSLFIAALTALFPGFDQWVAKRFFAGISALEQWPWAEQVWSGPLRWIPIIITILVSVWALLSLVLRLAGKVSPILFTTPASLYLLITVILAPILIVNVGLKDHWQRPRPYQTVEFGGPWRFQPWWRAGGECNLNCSFVSGESASTAWLAAPASLLPPQWRAPAYGLVIASTVTVSVLRMAYGRHFLSDTVISAALTYLIIYLVHYWLFRKDRGYYGIRLAQWAGELPKTRRDQAWRT